MNFFKEVDLTLRSGLPISFIYEIYTPPSIRRSFVHEDRAGLAMPVDFKAPEEMQVEVDEGRLAAYGLTLADLDRAVARGNVNLPGGNLRDRRVQYLLRTINEFQTPADVSRAVVRSTPDGQVVRVGDLAEVRMAPQEREEILRVDGLDTEML